MTDAVRIWHSDLPHWWSQIFCSPLISLFKDCSSISSYTTGTTISNIPLFLYSHRGCCFPISYACISTHCPCCILASRIVVRLTMWHCMNIIQLLQVVGHNVFTTFILPLILQLVVATGVTPHSYRTTDLLNILQLILTITYLKKK